MSFTWTQHRFSGGALALDVANSVILRHDPARSADRFAEAAHREAFPSAASSLCAERHAFGVLAPALPQDVDLLLQLREAVDSYFRGRTLRMEERASLAALLDAIAAALRQNRPEENLLTATARSALRLASGTDADRMKVCGHCGWLFIDRSKNRSRTWCDMTVCGNRVKASRHYAAQKAGRASKGVQDR